MNKFLMELVNAKMGITPVDLNTAANPGARISLEKGDRVTCIILLADGTSALDLTVSINQHDAASAGNTKACSQANPYYHKVDTATVFTKVVPVAAAGTVDLTALFANDPGIAVLEVCAEDLDVNNGYKYVSFSLPDAGAAKLGAALLILNDCRYLPPYEQAL